ALVVAILLGAGALWLAKRQIDIANRQMEMQAEQHEFFSEQLAMRPKVQLIVVGMLQRTHEIKTERRQVLLTIARRGTSERKSPMASSGRFAFRRSCRTRSALLILFGSRRDTVPRL